MSDVALEVSHVWKRFHRGELHDSLRDLVPALAKRLMGRGPKAGELGEGDFWALRDLSFQVRQGEVLGVIGANGAGKSTLLKLLARILRPNRGFIRVRGRLRALIEIAAGFHPDLTGRENIYLNGSILGMRKREIDAKFDEIVEFAGIGPFLDTPVKRYSSGMHARLGFAVAAHLEPEILLVDEVLAVGDAEFQKKCLGKMRNAAGEGRTVLFVSHNMAAVQALCQRALLLRDGSLVEDGPAHRVVGAYLNAGRESTSGCVRWSDPAVAPGNEWYRFRSVSVRSRDGRAVQEINSGDGFRVEVEYWSLAPDSRIGTTVVLYNEDGLCVFASFSNREPKWHGRPRPKGLFVSACHVPGNLLPEGRFAVSVLLWKDQYQSGYRLDKVVAFRVYEAGGARGDFFGGTEGVIRPLLPWTTEFLGDRLPVSQPGQAKPDDPCSR